MQLRALLRAVYTPGIASPCLCLAEILVQISNGIPERFWPAKLGRGYAADTRKAEKSRKSFGINGAGGGESNRPLRLKMRKLQILRSARNAENARNRECGYAADTHPRIWIEQVPEYFSPDFLYMQRGSIRLREGIPFNNRNPVQYPAGRQLHENPPGESSILGPPLTYTFKLIRRRKQAGLGAAFVFKSCDL